MYTIPRIDYAMLAKSQEFYQVFGYQDIEVPWMASGTAIGATIPNNKNAVFIPSHSKFLVGSAETGFIEMMLDNALRPGKYQSISPCFRDDELDKYHMPYFMKNELIIVEPDDAKAELEGMIENAFNFFAMFLEKSQMKLAENEPGVIDIMAAGVELGSYGIRSFKGFQWIFGTGCALPRLSQVRQKMFLSKRSVTTNIEIE